MVVGVRSSLDALTLPGISNASDPCVTFDEVGAIGMSVCSGVGNSPDILLESRCRK